MRQEVIAVAQPARAAQFHGGPHTSLSWRHAATLALLAVTLPVFCAAGLAALPVLLAVGGIELMRRTWLQRSTLHTQPTR